MERRLSVARKIEKNSLKNSFFIVRRAIFREFYAEFIRKNGDF
jgi:hypothetical protein